MRAGRAPVAVAVLAGLLLAAGLAPRPAAAEAKLINPCRFSSVDAPCKVRGGTYRALIPQTPGPHPAVVYLYGSFGLSDRVIASGYFQRAVVRRGYALIVPSALEVRYRGGRSGTGWGRKARTRHPRDDLDYLRRVLRDAEARFNVDPDRLIFAGQSDGGFFIWEIACHHPRMAAAFAVHAATYGWRLPERCSEPVRFLQAHGRADRVVPVAGPVDQGGGIPGADVETALGVMARTARCRVAPRDLGRFRGFERRRWEGCADRAGVDFLVHDGGHGWPPSWLPAVLDWFEERRLRPAEAITRRPGDEAGFFRGTAGGSGGFFKRAPSD